MISLLESILIDKNFYLLGRQVRVDITHNRLPMSKI
jgi:hypothetical protein